ncbi:MAG TPA: class A beta-lactamase [Allosphingosinicella sp.]|nr:class A beta-lactamase [Allosphingosinicella sp.]
MIDRRTFLIAGTAFAVACSERPATGQNAARGRSRASAPDFARLRAALGEGGRLGVAALDTGSGRILSHDPDSRYAMASTFKAPLAAAILAEVEHGRLSLDRELSFTRADLVNNSPTVEANLDRGRLSIERLCEAAIALSDNAAANLLLGQIGGPEGLTRFARGCGDQVTRFDRTEPALNTNIAGDPRDTTTPAAMIGLLRALLAGDALQPASRARMIGWMQGARTGLDRLRGGLPRDWRPGDKTGTGSGANNDIAIAFPPGRPPILIASYTTGGNTDNAARNAVHAEVARLVAAAFA